MMMTKKILLILITFHVSLFTATAQKLLVEKPTLECGRTGFQQPVTAIFDLKNKSRKKLVIESVKPDCGCTAVEYPKEVGAGDKFTIKMTYDARQLGHFQKSAAVISNASKQPVYLTMRGVVLTEVQDYTTNYYFDCLSKGRHTIESEYFIDRAGRYETGTCTVQCAYAPEFRGTTKSQTIIIK